MKKMNMRTSYFSRSLVAAVLFAGAGIAAADSGIYIGAGIGKSNVNDELVVPPVGNIAVSAQDTAAKAFLGYRFTALPILDLAAELAYNDFGKPSQSTNGQSLQYKLNGASLAGLVIFPLGPIDLFGKAGALNWNLERTINGAGETHKGTSAFYGIGAGFRVGPIGLRAELEHFRMMNIDSAQMLSVSALFQF
jgi:hypothetical protein